MRAFDIIGVDFEFGLGIGGRGAVEQHRLDRLGRVGVLRVARDRDLTQIAAGGASGEHRTDILPRGCAGLGMRYRRDDFEILIAATDLRGAEREISALVQHDIELDPPIVAADVENMERGFGVRAKHQIDLHNRARILHNRARKCAACRHQDGFGRRQRPCRSKRCQIGIAPSFIAAGGDRGQTPSPRAGEGCGDLAACSLVAAG